MSSHTHVYGGLPEREKHYVEVVANTTSDGLVTPLVIIWDDGRRFRIDKVTNRRQAHSTKTGGTGMRYTIRVGGQQTHLWYEGPRWFVEKKVARTAWET